MTQENKTNMNAVCRDASALIPSYLDGELTEAQAAPLRKHLLSCQACRGSAQSEKNLKRWFVEAEAPAVPKDFAARVARRAFAGDRGEPVDVDTLAGIASKPRTRPLTAAKPERVLRFVLALTSVAAQNSRLPRGSELSADDRVTPTLEQVEKRLDELNKQEAEAKRGVKTP
jgi:anti-sigma factor RsiW